MSTLAPDKLAELRGRIAGDWPFFAENCARIVPKKRSLGLVPFRLNTAQLRLEQEVQVQKAAGLPVRVLELKARQLGMSTDAQGRMIQHTTQHANHDGLVVAQDKKTGGHLFSIGEQIYQQLPSNPDLAIKPAIANRNRRTALYFGNPAKQEREAGNIGINSSYVVDTANEMEAGRGQTYTAIHASEVAFWPDIETKLLGLLSTVPYEPETFVILESTANGNNFFRDLWDDAKDGRNGYIPFFAAWFLDPDYSLGFINDQDRYEFIEQIGEGPYGEEEPQLQEEYGLTPEQLHWRRTMLDRPEMAGDLRKFHQEYPSFPEQAFITTGHSVFDQHRVQIIVNRCLRETDPETPTGGHRGPELGVFQIGKTKTQKGRDGRTLVEVPTEAVWRTRQEANVGLRQPLWRVWEQPTDDGRYLVVVDPAEGEEIERGESDFSAIQVLDHQTRHQVAEYRSRIDADLVGMEAFLAALHWNQAILVVEKTGVGDAIAKKLYKDFRWPAASFYRRKQAANVHDRESDDIGWSTDRKTKDWLVTTAIQTLRESVDSGDLDIVRSRLLADEMTSYMRDERGRTGARKGRHDDLLMAWMIGHEVAGQMRPRAVRKGQGTVSMLSDQVRQRWQIRG